MYHYFHRFFKRKWNLGKFNQILPNFKHFIPCVLNSADICQYLLCSARKHSLATRLIFCGQGYGAGNDFVKDNLRWKVFQFVPFGLWLHRKMLFKKTEKNQKQSKTKNTHLPGTEILCMCCCLQCMPRHSWAPEPTWRDN